MSTANPAAQAYARQHVGTLSDVASRLRQAVREIDRAADRLSELPQSDGPGDSTQEADEAADLRELVVQLEQTSAWASVKSANLLRALAAEDGA